MSSKEPSSSEAKPADSSTAEPPTSPVTAIKSTDPNENIPHPTYELYRHTLLRGANAGSLIALMFTPPVLLFRGTRDPRAILYRTGRASIYGVIIGVGATAVMTYMRSHSFTDEEMYDRAYRLRCNKPQNHMDTVTYSMVAAGTLAGGLTAPVMRATGALTGGALGFGLATFVHLATKNKD